MEDDGSNETILEIQVRGERGVEENLKKDRDGQHRTAYSLRHTHICLRLMEGADVYQITKNCRPSVEMIEKYYASHLRNSLAAAAIDIRRPKTKKKNEPPAELAV